MIIDSSEKNMLSNDLRIDWGRIYPQFESTFLISKNESGDLVFIYIVIC